MVGLLLGSGAFLGAAPSVSPVSRRSSAGAVSSFVLPVQAALFGQNPIPQ
jgi:hypothetical protein